MSFRKQIAYIFGLVAAASVLGFGSQSKAYQMPAVGLLGHFTDDAGLVPDFTTSSVPTNANAAKQKINNPNGVVIDIENKILWATDTNNNRVLGFGLDANYSLIDGNADFVLGQANFDDTAAATTQAGMDTPWGIAMDQSRGRLYVGDSGNNRILVFDLSVAITNGANAVGVIFHNDFTTKTGGRSEVLVDAPRGLTYDEGNDRLFVADTTNNRIIAVDDVSTAGGTASLTSSLVLGQADFLANSAPTSVTAATMNGPDGVLWDNLHKRLFVSDNDNNRVLVFVAATITSALTPANRPVSASNVLGQASMTEKAGSRTSTGMFRPCGFAYDEINDRLFVSEANLADTASSYDRVLIFDVSTITDGEAATGLLGEQLFDDSTSSSVVNDKILHVPTGLFYSDISRQLFVADNTRDRVMVFQMPYINTSSMPAAVVGATYDNDLVVSGGKTPYTFEALSDMAALNAAGIAWSTNAGWLYGFPNRAGSFLVSIKLTDGSVDVDQAGFTDIANFTINITGTNPNQIGVPTSLSAVAASSTQVNLTWVAPTSLGSGIAGYKLYRDGATSPTAIITGNVTNFSDTGLTAETQYSYTVAAYDTDGIVSEKTSAVLVTTLQTGQVADLERPIAPTTTGSAVSSSQINLSWTGATDNVGVTGYQVYRDGVLVSTVTSGTTYNDTGLTANTTYSYMVFAKDAANNISLAPTPVSIKTPVAASGETPTTPTTPSTTSNDSDDHKKKEEAPKRVIKNSSRFVARGSIMVQSGKAFSKNATLSLYYTNKNGVYTTKPVILKSNSKGAFSTAFKVTKPAGTYKWYVVDGRSGRKSKVKTYIVL